MIEVHQAIFGEGRDRGHSLLNSSYPTETIPNQISGFTDLVDRPVNGVLSTPIVRGFMVKENFLLIKSFPDPTGRQGRVFSHALILKKEDFLKVSDITDLLNYHLSEIDKSAVTAVIHFENGPVHTPSLVTPAMINATGAMINHLENGNKIVWIGEEGYWSWISRIWPQIPMSVKTEMRIGAVFNARNVDGNKLNLITIPAELHSNWNREKCAIIEKNDPPIPETDLIRFFNGHMAAENGLNILISELHPKITEIDDLYILDQYTSLYQNINITTAVQDILVFADLLTRYNPDPKSAISGKKKIIDALGRELKNASSDEISFLQYQSWNGYDEKYIDSVLKTPLEHWLIQNLLTGGQTPQKVKIAVAALTAQIKFWWHKYIGAFIQRILINWNESYAIYLFSWIKEEPEICKILFPLLPNEAEKDLIVNVPILEKAVSETIIDAAIEKKWLGLTGTISIGIYSSRVAFARILSLDNDGSADTVLEVMAAKIKGKWLIADAIELSDPRLILLASKRVVIEPDLKQTLVVNNINWQKIWLQSYENGLELWKGIKDAGVILTEIMNLVIEKVLVEPQLIIEISKSRFASLKDYDNRALLWNELPNDSKGGFLSATLTDYLKDINRGKIKFADFERPLQEALEVLQVKKDILIGTSLSASSKLQLFRTFSSYDEHDAQLMLRNTSFSNEEAEQLGTLVAEKGWRYLANDINTARHFSPEMEKALRNCYQLLNFWDRLFLSDKGYAKETISTDEFWNVLLTKTTENYPDGPNQNGLWENAGGRRSDLHTHGSGQEIWTNAINNIKRGGRPNARDLLNKMIEDFPYDDSLKKLKNII